MKIFLLSVSGRILFSYFFLLPHPHTHGDLRGRVEARNVYINMCCVKLNGKVYSLLDFITQKRTLKNGNESKNLHLKVAKRGWGGAQSEATVKGMRSADDTFDDPKGNINFCVTQIGSDYAGSALNGFHFARKKCLKNNVLLVLLPRFLAQFLSN